MVTVASLMGCEEECSVVFDDLDRVHQHLSTLFPQFDLLPLVRDIQTFATQHDIRFDSVSIAIEGVALRMEWFAREGTSDFLLSRILLVRNGVKVAIHNYFTLPFRLQGLGLAPQVLRPFYTQYKAASVAQIELTAAKSIGGYVWAIAGFSAIEKQEVASILEIGRLRDIPHAFLELYYTVFHGFYENNPTEPPFPMRLLATLPDGKTLLKNSVWKGVLNLLDKQQTTTFELYLSKS